MRPSKNPLSRTLVFQDHRRHLTFILDAARRAADPRLAMLRALKDHPPRCWPKVVIAVGKAALAMDEGLSEAMGSCAMTRCIVVPAGSPTWGESGSLLFADHPLPSHASYRAARRIEFLLATRRSRHNCPGILFLLSGGASSLLSYPCDGLSIDDARAVTEALMHAGAPIVDLNTVRKHTDALKGGRLAACAAPLDIDAYILSDVIDDRLDTIGSGPVSPDPTTFADALAVLDRFRLRDAAPKVTAILESGARGEHPDTPKPGDPVFDHVRSRIIAGNLTALSAAQDAARELGFRMIDCRPGVCGEARAVGTELAKASLAAANSGPACILLGGETTVTVRSTTGRGGRCQELALACAAGLEGSPGIAVAAFATDGVDGNTDAAGAIVTGHTVTAAQRDHGLSWQEALAANNSHALLDATGSLIRTGPTGTNVCDVAAVLIY
ncbi:MAG: DUF4147 domain-containing protein [Phycisphaerales bacterium]|nr:DUF4147 domain-containing protein [Phycisphaerales bacterium]